MQQLEYDAFGVVLSDSNPGFQPFGFAGGLYDWDSGLVRFGARDYDAAIGRWTAKDLIGFAGLQANVYVYVGNDPVNFVDRTGEFPTVIIGAVVGAAAGATSAWLAGGDRQAIIASGLGGAVAGAIAGTGGILVGGAAIFSTGEILGLAGLGSAAGGMVSDLGNLRPGMELITGQDVVCRFTSRFVFGALGGGLAMGIQQLAAPGLAGVVSSQIDEFLVGVSSSTMGDYMCL